MGTTSPSKNSMRLCQCSRRYLLQLNGLLFSREKPPLPWGSFPLRECADSITYVSKTKPLTEICVIRDDRVKSSTLQPSQRDRHRILTLWYQDLESVRSTSAMWRKKVSRFSVASVLSAAPSGRLFSLVEMEHGSLAIHSV